MNDHSIYRKRPVSDYISVLDLRIISDKDNKLYMSPRAESLALYPSPEKILGSSLFFDAPVKTFIHQKTDIFSTPNLEKSLMFNAPSIVLEILDKPLTVIPRHQNFISNSYNNPHLFVSQNKTHSNITFLQGSIQELEKDLTYFRNSISDARYHNPLLHESTRLEFSDFSVSAFRDRYFDLEEIARVFYYDSSIQLEDAVERVYQSQIRKFKKQLARLLKSVYHFISRDLRRHFRYLVQFLFKNMDDESADFINSNFLMSCKELIKSLNVFNYEKKYQTKTC